MKTIYPRNRDDSALLLMVGAVCTFVVSRGGVAPVPLVTARVAGLLYEDQRVTVRFADLPDVEVNMDLASASAWTVQIGA